MSAHIYHHLMIRVCLCLCFSNASIWVGLLKHHQCYYIEYGWVLWPAWAYWIIYAYGDMLAEYSHCYETLLARKKMSKLCSRFVVVLYKKDFTACVWQLSIREATCRVEWSPLLWLFGCLFGKCRTICCLINISADFIIRIPEHWG